VCVAFSLLLAVSDHDLLSPRCLPVSLWAASPVCFPLAFFITPLLAPDTQRTSIALFNLRD